MGHWGGGAVQQGHPHCTRTNVPRWPEVRSSISQSPCGSPAGSQLGASLVRHCGRGAVGRATGPALMCKWVSRSRAADATGDMPAWRSGAGSSGIPDMRRPSQGVSMYGTGDDWGPCWQPEEVTEWCCNWSSLKNRETGRNRSPCGPRPEALRFPHSPGGSHPPQSCSLADEASQSSVCDMTHP